MINILLDVQSSEELAQFEELLNALDSAQIEYDVSENEETGEKEVSFDEVYEDDVISALETVGIGYEEETVESTQDSGDTIDSVIAGDISVDDAILEIMKKKKKKCSKK